MSISYLPEDQGIQIRKVVARQLQSLVQRASQSRAIPVRSAVYPNRLHPVEEFEEPETQTCFMEIECHQFPDLSAEFLPKFWVIADYVKHS